MKCMKPADNKGQCPFCMVEEGAPCPMVDLDTSHQGREDPPLTAEVSPTPAAVLAGPVAEVVHFRSRERVQTSTDGKPINPDVVEQLEHYLERAKNGEITGLAVAAQVYEGGMSTYWTSPDSGGILTLLGAMEHLKWRINDILDGDATQESTR